MLAYLDRLCAALLARDTDEIRRLLRHPLSHALPRRVRSEAIAIARAGARGLRAPMQTLNFYHQTAHLLGAIGDPAAPAVKPKAKRAAAQMELELGAVA